MDRPVIALWLGHESIETTQIDLDANLAMKEQALAKTAPPEGEPGRYRPDDQLLPFLKGLWHGRTYAEPRPFIPAYARDVRPHYSA